MKPDATAPNPIAASVNYSAEERGLAAVKVMSKALKAEHKRWGMPLLTWKNGRIVSVKP